MNRWRWWLESAETRIPLHGSVLVGRSPECNLVLRDERASRHHALFRVVEDGVEVIPLGRNGIGVNDHPRSEPTTLAEGDVVEVAGHRVVLRGAVEAHAPEVLWYVERGPGLLVRLLADATPVGGGGDDAIVVEGWPPRVMTLLLTGERCVLEAHAAGIRVGAPLHRTDLTPLRSGDQVEFLGTRLRVVALPADPSKPTGVPALAPLATSVGLALLPRGGHLSVATGTQTRSVWLTERRGALVHLLLAPPSPYGAGEWVPDAVIAEALWPGAESGRIEINTLVCRVRRDLDRAGIDGVSLIERRGGALRVALAPGASVSVTGP